MCIRSNQLAILVAMTVMMIGYGEAEAQSSCEPEERYDECWQVGLSDLEYWQDTLDDPQWRSVEKLGDVGSSAADPPGHGDVPPNETDPPGHGNVGSSAADPPGHGDVPPNEADPPGQQQGRRATDRLLLDYRVTIDARSLNGGVIPTAPGQGHYESEEEFAQAVEDLLGVPIDSRTLVQIRGTTTKMAVKCGPAHRSTGSFVNDALTDETGRLFIAGEDRTTDYIRPYRQAWGHQLEGDCENGLEADEGKTDDDMEAMTVASSGGIILPTWYSLLADGIYEADLWTRSGFAAFDKDEWTRQVGSRIDNVRHYLLPNACIAFWDFDAQTIEIQCMVADKLYLENKYPKPAHCLCRGNAPACAAPWEQGFEEGDANPSYDTTALEVFLTVPDQALSGDCWGAEPTQLLEHHCAEGWAYFVKPDVSDSGRVWGFGTTESFCEWDD